MIFSSREMNSPVRTFFRSRNIVVLMLQTEGVVLNFLDDSEVMCRNSRHCLLDPVASMKSPVSSPSQSIVSILFVFRREYFRCPPRTQLPATQPFCHNFTKKTYRENVKKMFVERQTSICSGGLFSFRHPFRRTQRTVVRPLLS